MNFRCLVLDHDDTVVRSAETVNYPAFLENMQGKPFEKEVSFREFILGCFQYGFSDFCRKCLGMTEQDLEDQFVAWKAYIRVHIPPAYEGMNALLHRFRKAGGIICVSSHSSVENITRDYRRDFDLLPDAIYAWELGEELRKPNPYTLKDIMKRFRLQPQDLLMVDDMKAGCDMAKCCGVPFGCAGWSVFIPELQESMHCCSDYYFHQVKDLENLLFNA